MINSIQYQKIYFHPVLPLYASINTHSINDKIESQNNEIFYFHYYHP